MKSIIFNTLFTLVLAALASSVHAGKLYKWVDDDGNISYQDQPPPKNSKILSEKTIKSGIVSQPNTASGLPKIVIYIADDCQPCDDMSVMLKQHKIPHVELPIENDRKAQQRILKQVSSLIMPTTFIDDDIIQGRTPEQVKELLKSVGFDVGQDET